MNRGDAAAGTWIVRGDESNSRGRDVDRSRSRAATTPRLAEVWSRSLRALLGTWHSEFHASMKPADGDAVVTGKKGLDAFPGTDLEAILKSKGIETVVLCGFLTNCCVESSMRTASARRRPPRGSRRRRGRDPESPTVEGAWPPNARGGAERPRRRRTPAAAPGPRPSTARGRPEPAVAQVREGVQHHHAHGLLRDDVRRRAEGCLRGHLRHVLRAHVRRRIHEKALGPFSGDREHRQVRP